MKRTILTILTVVLFALSTIVCSGAESANMIKNGNFEGTDLTNFEDFQLGMPENKAMIVPGGHSGMAIQMGGDVDNNGWPAWINFRIGNLSLKKNHFYKLTGWVKGTENIILDAQCHLLANLKPPKHREVYHPIALVAADNGVKVTKSWTKFEINFEMKNPLPNVDPLIVDAPDWNIFFQYGTPQEGVTFPKSSILFDDLSLVEIDSLPTSSKPGSGATSTSNSSKTTTPSSKAGTSTDPNASVTPGTSTANSSSDESAISDSSSNTESITTSGNSSANSTPGTKDTPANNMIIFIIIGAVIVVGGGAAALYFLVLKKKA